MVVHSVACIHNSYLFHSQQYSMVQIYHSVFIYPLVNLNCFHILAIIMNAAMNICMQVFVWTYIFISLVWIPRNGIVVLYVKHVFNFLKIGIFFLSNVMFIANLSQKLPYKISPPYPQNLHLQIQPTMNSSLKLPESS